MNPVLLATQVEQGLEDLVRYNFQTNSDNFQGMIETFLSNPDTFFKGPWISVDLPFQDSDTFNVAFPEIPLDFEPYLHQQQAFDRLCLPSPKSTLIATGTGSGKTECYLWPILEACRQSIGQTGIKAIIIYPMNALASDQARRIAKVIKRIDALTGVRCGLYADSEPKPSNEKMLAEEVITSRKQMRENPPDILLTNYKMLDYLLLRSQDKKLWAKNSPETLQFLVVDELHTFDGAQGTDLALLIRRLKSRLKTPPDHLVCIGSSATLGIEKKSQGLLTAYAEKIFGEKFDSTSVIQENRKELNEEFENVEHILLPDPDELSATIERGLELDQPTIVSKLSHLFFYESDLETMLVEGEASNNPEDNEWKLNLGRLLWSHVAFQRVIEIIYHGGKAVTIDAIVERLAEAKFLRPKWSPVQRTALVKAIVILASWARKQKNPGSSIQPLLSIRVQAWAREMGRMLALLPNSIQKNRPHSAVLRHSDDLEESDLQKALPVVICRNCGMSGQACRISEDKKRLWETPDILYAEWFEKSEQLRILFYEEISAGFKEKDKKKLYKINVNTQTLEYNTNNSDSRTENFIEAWIFDPINNKNRNVERTCPSCGTERGLLILGLRTARLTAGLSTTLFNSEHHEAGKHKPRVLMFSDSVQDAAQRASVNEIRNKQFVVEKTVYDYINLQPDKEKSLRDLILYAKEELPRQMSEADYIAKFVARDQTWRDPYKVLSKQENEGDFSNEHFAEDVATRLGWDIFANLTFRSRTGQTLETSKVCVADVRPNKLLDASEDFQQKLIVKISKGHYLSEQDAFSFLYGLVVHMRRNGAVGHNFLRQALTNASRQRGLNYIGASYRPGLGRREVIPTKRSYWRIYPVLPATHGLGIHPDINTWATRHFKYVAGGQPSNWYRAWVIRFFHEIDIPYTEIYKQAFESLAGSNIVEEIKAFGKDGIPVWVLRTDAINVTTNLADYQCEQCGRPESFSEYEFSELKCMKIGCNGTLQATEHYTQEYDNNQNSSSSEKRSRYYTNILSASKNYRVVAREHTGLLEAKDRHNIEKLFINGEKQWHPNLISATPTLELGIDIGDLSTLILASVPPDVANYVQRIGRTGRRDGNSLNITLVSARSHDLQFWEDPTPMLKGQITPPGVYLEAVAVLRRQATAFALDKFVADEENEFEYGIVKDVLEAIEKEFYTEFPYNWFSHLQLNADTIVDKFIEFLPENVRENKAITDEIRSYLTSSQAGGLRYSVLKAFDDMADERSELSELRRKLSSQKSDLEKENLAPKDRDPKLDRLKKRISEISKTIKKTINQVPVLKFLTDRGILPNYAFPEEGVKLKSIIVKDFVEEDADANQFNKVEIKEYKRPVSIAITELAPNQTFYAEGRELVINRIDIRENDVSNWRFCQNCNYSEPNKTGESKPACPKCSNELWSDAGSCAQTVELRSVIASTTEQEATIKDLDGRLQRHYDTEIIPKYGQEQVRKAYILVESDKPFGMEFISNCEFRNINFGERSASGSKVPIAGKERKSRPFKICKFCGTIQNTGYNEEGGSITGSHEERCQAEEYGGDRDKWEATVFLINTFHTEALRMLVPVPGEANFDEIKSFVAGVELGLRKYFQGRVDHIRSTVVEDRIESGAMVRNLFFYDTIPGGSGYLRQLALNPNSLWEVFDRAAKALRQCPCNNDEEKNGCFRCVKPYRSQFGRGEPKRDIAQQLIDDVLTNWDSLKEVETSIDKDLGPSITESALEDKFIHHLRKKFKPENLKSIVLDNGRRGFQLKVPLVEESTNNEASESESEPNTTYEASTNEEVNSSSQNMSASTETASSVKDTITSKTKLSEEQIGSVESLNQVESTETFDESDSSSEGTENPSFNPQQKEKSIYWTIESQVQIEKRFPGLPKKRVDFLISSTHPKAKKPIVVETDGFRFHYDSVKKDVEDRVRMIKSGQVEVWTFVWDDFEKDSPDYYNPFGSKVISKKFDEGLIKLFQSASLSSLHHLKRTVEILRSESSINGLIERLNCRPWTPSEATTLLALILLSSTMKDVKSVDSSELDEDSRLFWQEAENQLRLSDRSLSLFAGIPKCQPAEIAEQVDHVRMVLFADLEEVDEDSTNQEEFKKTWSSLWRSVNFLQTLRGFHVVLPGMDTIQAKLTPDLSQVISDQTNALWQEVFDLTEDEVLETVKSLCNSNLSIPDMVGADIMVNDAVACTVEIGWSRKKFGVALETSEATGWTILENVDPKSTDYKEFLQKIIDVVSGGER